MAGSAVVGAMLLALIEGMGIMLNKYQSQFTRPQDPRDVPQDPSQLDLKNFQ